MSCKLVFLAVLGFVALSLAEIQRYEKGKGGNAKIIDKTGNGGGGKQISGLISGWEITKGGKCLKSYGKIVNVAPGQYWYFAVAGGCAADIKSLTPTNPGYIGTANTQTNDAGTYLVANLNKKGMAGVDLTGKSFIISDGKAIVACGDFSVGEMIVLKDGADEGGC